ncbi:hypothetical protein LAUMK13_02979 [Mycobacterium innocens]|uniref:Uncharacterized protein n=1 Tax=Mycobacterium innocens TaxID=2341083 RepID=A0A498Q5W0_9MYCO|nr:hypothetical protein LAUMK13_02979 [Mycobacterium innocens]
MLPQIKNWLNTPGHTEEVILLYLEDELQDAAAYSSTLATLGDMWPNGMWRDCMRPRGVGVALLRHSARRSSS